MANASNRPKAQIDDALRYALEHYADGRSFRISDITASLLREGYRALAFDQISLRQAIRYDGRFVCLRWGGWIQVRGGVK